MYGYMPPVSSMLISVGILKGRMGCADVPALTEFPSTIFSGSSPSLPLPLSPSLPLSCYHLGSMSGGLDAACGYTELAPSDASWQYMRQSVRIRSRVRKIQQREQRGLLSGEVVSGDSVSGRLDEEKGKRSMSCLSARAKHQYGRLGASHMSSCENSQDSKRYFELSMISVRKDYSILRTHLLRIEIVGRWPSSESLSQRYTSIAWLQPAALLATLLPP